MIQIVFLHKKEKNKFPDLTFLPNQLKFFRHFNIIFFQDQFELFKFFIDGTMA